MTRIVFMGSKTGGLALCSLLCDRPDLPTPSLVLCPDDRSDERSCLAAFEALCTKHAVPMHCLADSGAVLAALSGLPAATVVLVHGWYRPIPVERLPGLRFFGFHYAPLPAYRGNAPLVWQILRGETRIGISFFCVGPGMDDGDLVAQRTFELGPDETIADALQRAEAACIDVATSCLAPLLQGTLRPTPQASTGASYCGLRTPEDGRIDWSEPANRVHDFVRAQSRPYPGAFTELSDGRRLKIWRTQLDPRRVIAPFGAVVAVEAPAVVVGCGHDSAVRVVSCSLDGMDDTAPASLIGSLRVRLGHPMRRSANAAETCP